YVALNILPPARAGREARFVQPDGEALGLQQRAQVAHKVNVLFAVANEKMRHAAPYNSRITRAGLPAATTPGGTSPVTTLPAPMIRPAPIVTPLRMSDCIPMNT